MMDLNEAKIIAEMNHDGFPLGKIMAMYPVTHDALNWALAEIEASKTTTDYAALEKQRDDCQQEITNCRKIMEKQGIVIAALERERDELKRRCEAIKAHVLSRDMLSIGQIIAIAEGRDNG